MASVGYRLNLLYYVGIHIIECFFMDLRERKILDVGKIVGTQVKVERGDREVFHLNVLPRVKIVQCLWHMP